METYLCKKGILVEAEPHYTLKYNILKDLKVES
jgi:hypothetical protein